MRDTSTGATCWTVIRGAVAGREEDREAFARRYLPVIASYLRARWVGTSLAGEVDDAVQEVFLDCFRDGGALGRADATRPGGFRAFLLGVVRNIARRKERDRYRAREVQPATGFEDGLRAREESLAASFDRAFARTVLREAADRHLERAREQSEAAVRRHEVLRLRFEEGLPVREIAARLDLPARRVQKDYGLAREEFRRALLEVVAFHAPGTPAEVEAECVRLVALVRP